MIHEVIQKIQVTPFCGPRCSYLHSLKLVKATFHHTQTHAVTVSSAAACSTQQDVARNLLQGSNTNSLADRSYLLCLEAHAGSMLNNAE